MECTPGYHVSETHGAQHAHDRVFFGLSLGSPFPYQVDKLEKAVRFLVDTYCCKEQTTDQRITFIVGDGSLFTVNLVSNGWNEEKCYRNANAKGQKVDAQLTKIIENMGLPLYKFNILHWDDAIRHNSEKYHHNLQLLNNTFSEGRAIARSSLMAEHFAAAGNTVEDCLKQRTLGATLLGFAKGMTEAGVVDSVDGERLWFYAKVMEAGESALGPMTAGVAEGTAKAYSWDVMDIRCQYVLQETALFLGGMQVSRWHCSIFDEFVDTLVYPCPSVTLPQLLISHLEQLAATDQTSLFSKLRSGGSRLCHVALSDSHAEEGLPRVDSLELSEK
jgi:hypothetical protein